MRFTTLLLAEHAVVSDSGLVGMLNGAANRIARPIFPAPFGLTLVAVIQLDAGYADGTVIPVEFTVTSPDASEVFGRAEGEVVANLIPGSDRRVGNATIVLDLSGVALTKAGVYAVTGSIAGAESLSVFVEVVQSDRLPSPTHPQNVQYENSDS